MNDKQQIITMIMIPAIVICYIVADLYASYMSKSKNAYFNHEIDKSKIKEIDGSKYFLLKSGSKFRVYIPHSEDNFLFRPLWVPLSQYCLGADCGAVEFDSEELALLNLKEYLKNGGGEWKFV